MGGNGRIQSVLKGLVTLQVPTEEEVRRWKFTRWLKATLTDEQKAGELFAYMGIAVATVLAYLGFLAPMLTLSATSSDGQSIEASFSLWEYLGWTIQPLLIASALVALVKWPRIRGTIIASWLFMGGSALFLVGMLMGTDALAVAIYLVSSDAPNVEAAALKAKGQLLQSSIEFLDQLIANSPSQWFFDNSTVRGFTIVELRDGVSYHGMFLVWFVLSYGLYGVVFWMARSDALDMRKRHLSDTPED